MSNIIQKFKAFPLSIKIIVIFCAIGIIESFALYFLFPVDFLWVYLVVLSILLFMQIRGVFIKSRGTFVFSLIQILIAFLFLFLHFAALAHEGASLRDPFTVWTMFIGFTFELPFVPLIRLLNIEIPILLRVMISFSPIVLIILEIWKIIKIKKYCVK